MKKLIYLSLLCIALGIVLSIACYAQNSELLTGYQDFFKTLENSNNIDPSALSATPDPSLTGHTTTPATEDTKLITPEGTISNIAGSYNLLIFAGSLIGGIIISSADNNAIPTFNPLTGDVVIYNMNKGDKVTVDYTSEPAYKAEMSEGVQAEIQTPQRIRFTAYSDNSYLKIKPTEEPSFNFKNGLLEYENSKIIEQIDTTKENNANVDQDYELGFKCFTLASNATYNYINKEDASKSFSFQNLNPQEYQVCIKKTIYDDYPMASQLNCVIDLVKDEAKFKAKFLYSKINKISLESLDERNEITIEYGMGKKKLTITNPAPTNDIISRFYSGYHKITEKLENRKAVRYHEFTSTEHSPFIDIYQTNFRNIQSTIEIIDGMLVQKEKNKFTAMVERNHDCLNEVLNLFQYKEPEDFYNVC